MTYLLPIFHGGAGEEKGMLIAGQIGINFQQNLDADLARFFDQRGDILGCAHGRIGLLKVDDINGRKGLKVIERRDLHYGPKQSNW